MEFGVSRHGSPAKCRACLSLELGVDARSGDFVCRKCGEIQGSRLIVESSEVRNFDDNEGPQDSGERHGGLPDTNAWGGMSIFISSGRGNDEITAVLNKCSAQTNDSKSEMLAKVMKMVSELSYCMHLPNTVTDQAEALFHRALATSCHALFARKRIPVAAVASLLYLACKLEKVGRTVDEICAATGWVAARPEVWKIQGKLCHTMGLAIGHVTPEEVVTRIGSASKQSGEVIEKARQGCRAVTAKVIFSAQAPQLTAAAVLVMAALVSNSQISLRDVSRASISCSTQQICQAYTSLYAYADLVLCEESLGGFDLAHLPRQLVLGPAPSKRKKKKVLVHNEMAGAELINTPFAIAPCDNWQAEVAKVACAPKVDESKPRTRANSLVDAEEDTSVLAPLFPKKRKGGKSKARKRGLVEAAPDAAIDANGNVAKTRGRAEATLTGKARRLEAGLPLSPAGSLPSLNSVPVPVGSSSPEISSFQREGDEAGTTAAAASYLLARSTSDSSEGTSGSGAVSRRSRQAALDALCKHSSPLFRVVPKPTTRRS